MPMLKPEQLIINKTMKAKELLKNGETAIVIFTDGLNLEIDTRTTSQSGVWRVNKKLSFDKVIILGLTQLEGANSADSTNML